MTQGERDSFNAALASLNKHREFARLWRLIDHKVDVLGEQEALQLMRKIEAVVRSG